MASTKTTEALKAQGLDLIGPGPVSGSWWGMDSTGATKLAKVSGQRTAFMDRAEARAEAVMAVARQAGSFVVYHAGAYPLAMARFIPAGDKGHLDGSKPGYGSFCLDSSSCCVEVVPFDFKSDIRIVRGMAGIAQLQHWGS